MRRAYSLLNIKSVGEDERVIEGIASTPTTDRMGDVVDPMGAKFVTPFPLLWQHDSMEPVGEVFFAKPTRDGIPFKARFAQLGAEDAGPLKDRLDDAWRSIKLGLVKAVSIGFRSLAYEIMADGGLRFNEWEWLELSAVTIPANADATITTIRSIVTDLRAATGQTQDDDARPEPAHAPETGRIVRLQEPARAEAPYVIKKIVHTR